MNILGWHWSVAVGLGVSVGPRPIPVGWMLDAWVWWLGPVAIVRWRLEVPRTNWDVVE